MVTKWSSEWASQWSNYECKSSQGTEKSSPGCGSGHIGKKDMNKGSRAIRVPPSYHDSTHIEVPASQSFRATWLRANVNHGRGQSVLKRPCP